MAERGPRPEAEQNPEPNPWDVLGVPENASQKDADKALAGFGKEKGKSPEADEKYGEAYRAWVAMSDRLAASKGAPTSSISSETGRETEAGRPSDRYNNAAESLSRRTAAASEEKGEDDKKFKKFIKYGGIGVAVLASAVAIGGWFSGKEKPKKPAPNKPVAASVKEDSPKKEESPKVEQAPSALMPEKTEQPDQSSVNRKKFDQVFHKEYQRPSTERQNMPEESAQEQPESEPEQQIIEKAAERDILDDFHFFIPKCKPQSRGDRSFVISFGKNECCIVKPADFKLLGEVKKEYVMRVEAIKEQANSLLQDAGGNAIKTRAIMGNAKEHIERIRAAAERQMAKVLEEQCEEVPQDQIDQAFKNAKEMKKKADEQREKTQKRQI